jgi:ribosome recycling factor
MSPPKFISIPASKRKRVIHIPLSSATAQHRQFLSKLYQAAIADDKQSIKKLLQRASAGEIRALAQVSQNLFKKTIWKRTGNSCPASFLSKSC